MVGIKALDVLNVLGKRVSTSYAYQEEQNGTGHAVQVALKNVKRFHPKGIIYVLPGDMGLIDEETMTNFRKSFKESHAHMIVLTGIFNGDPKVNSYGRILRVKAIDANGVSSRMDEGKVIEIMEYKDILALPPGKPHLAEYKERYYSFTKEELINNNEYNSGVFAFRYSKLKELIGEIKK